MEEIKEGEYVRLSRNQGINKIIEIEEDGCFVLDDIIADEWGDETDRICPQDIEEEILKHSFSIIDLIEVGDIVELFDVLHYDIFCVWSEEAIKAIAEDVKEGMQIKSIVTKEQYESIKYVVGD